MKIRLFNNQLRVRINKPELEQLSTEQAIEMTTKFPFSELRIIIEPGTCDKMLAGLRQNIIFIELPKSWIEAMVTSDQVGFTSQVNLLPYDQLSLTIEKDFRCAHKPAKEQENLFVNINAN